MKLLDLATLLYVLKCVSGIIICYILYKAFPQYPFYWAIVSVAITVSPDSSNKLAYDRIMANCLGCAVALCLYPIHTSSLLLLSIGVAVTIMIGTFFKLTNVLRSAIAALVIVIINEEEHRSYVIALERVGCVIAGCVVALALTLIFNKVMQLHLKRLFGNKGPEPGTET